MQRTAFLLRLNKSTGYRWSAIPNPPPPHTDRLYGVHSVLNTFRVFASHGAGNEVLNDAGGLESDRTWLSTLTKEEEQSGGGGGGELESDDGPSLAARILGEKAPLPSSPQAVHQQHNRNGAFHPHRRFVNCLYVRDFSIEKEAKDRDGQQRTGNSSTSSSDHGSGSGDARRGRRYKTIPAKYSALHRITALAKDAQVPVRFVPRGELWRLCGERRNQNVVLEVGSYQPTRVQDASSLLPGLSAPSPSPTASTVPAMVGGADGDSKVVLYLDRLIDPTNVGSILRTAFFYGVDDVILSSDSASCTAAVARTSTGFLEFMNVQQSTVPTTTFLANTRKAFEEQLSPAADAEVEWALEIIGSTTQRPTLAARKVPESREAMAEDPTVRTQTQREKEEKQERENRPGARRKVFRLVVLGNEDAGLPEAVIQHCSHLLHIRSPRQERLDAANHREVRDYLQSLSVERNAAGTPVLSELQKRELMARKRRRLQRSEVTLNVNTACATLLSRLVEGDPLSSLVQVVANDPLPRVGRE